MNKGRILLVVLAALVPASAQTAQEESPQEAVERLGSPDADVREAAAAKLLKLGDAARPVLEKAVRSRDPEVAIRARGVLAKLDAKRDLPTRRRRLAGHSGFLKDDDLHLMWIEKPAFDLLADEALFPEQWRTDDERLKKYLEEKTKGDGEAAPFFDSFRLALIEMQEGRIKASELMAKRSSSTIGTSRTIRSRTAALARRNRSQFRQAPEGFKPPHGRRYSLYGPGCGGAPLPS